VNTLLRSLIVWLVLLAVPFQGFASAAMSGCASGHAAPASPPAPAPASHHAHAMTQAASGHDHAAMMQASDARADADAAHHGGAHKCSACSACSIGAAMAPGAAPALAVHAAPALSIPFADGHMPSVDLALPERPPRPLAA